MAATSGGKFNESAAATAFHNMANAAPSVIRGYLETISTAFTAFETDLKNSGYVVGQTPTPSEAASLASAEKVFTSPKLLAASKALQAWEAKNCS
jgi:glutathione S-transferase